MELKDILLRTKDDDKNVLDIFVYGSRVYANYRKDSDYDFIFVVKNKTREQFSDRLINVQYYTVDEHQIRLDEHEISALECHFLPKTMVIKSTTKFKFTLNLQTLRHSLSAKSSNSFVKAKKKLTVPESYDVLCGQKSLWHSIRIIDFGIQIATTGRIENYGSLNDMFSEILGLYDWQSMFDKFKTIHNKVLTEFRKLATK